ncbi:DUF3488 and transglutaminase-like domain-containing protein [Salinibacterium sp. PAMC 21357]|uniref:DUF3488 and transglutaminase-like domain-containing protein n=1 Tax=Salinibacterium sp. PAMC 21357 TaxID=1112215 RepID=UPI0002896740|nr:transglutaminase domain-containing protein [Salinibacterium sp. PAMC 21357]
MSRRNTLPSLGRTLWSVGFVALGIAIAAAAAWPIYQTPRVILLAVVAGIAGMGIAYLAARRAMSWWAATLAVLLVYGILVVPLAIPAALQSPLRVLAGIRDGFAGIVLGWKQLVTIELPLGDYQAVLVPLFVVIFLGAFGALSLALRPGKISVLAVPVVLGMFAFGLAFGSSALGAPVPVLWWSLPGGALVLLGVAVITLSMSWLIGRSRLARVEALKRARGTAVGIRQARETTWPIVRRNALGAAILIVAISVGFAVAPLAANTLQRTTVRDGVEPFLNISRVQSPLITYRGWFAGDALTTELFTVTDAPENLDRLRLATLTGFDGTRFELTDSAAANFTRLANSVPAATDLEVAVTIGEGYAGPWLPLPGVTSAAPSFSGERSELLTDGLFVAPGGISAVVVDGQTADAGIITATLSPGDRFVVSGSPLPESGVLEGAQGGEPLIDGEVHVALADWVDRQKLPRTGDGLLDAVSKLRERGFLSHARTEDTASEGWITALSSRADYLFEPSLAGHSTARIETLFTSLTDQEVKAGEDASEESLISAVGDDEQFSVAAALLARYFGFDSRIVFGVLLASDESQPSVVPCSADGVCTGANITAWTEVRSPDGQWVQLDATPQFSEPLSRVVVGEILPEHPTEPDEPSSEVLAPPVSIRAESDEPPASAENSAAGQRVWEIVRWVALAVAIVLLPLLPIVVLAGAKTLQRRRRRADPIPEVAIVGAWDELIDRYIDAGIISSPRGTRRQIALATGRPAALAVAEAADTAVFNVSASLPATADAVWNIVEAERGEVAKLASWRQRLAVTLSTASFVRHIKEAQVRLRGAA